MIFKDRFIKTQDAGAWSKIVESLPFERATETALLELMEGHRSNDAGSAAANAYRLEGAQQFVRILTGLTKVPEPSKRDNVGQLKHNL